MCHLQNISLHTNVKIKKLHLLYLIFEKKLKLIFNYFIQFNFYSIFTTYVVPSEIAFRC